MLFTSGFFSLFRYDINILDVTLKITPQDVIIYNPFFHNDITLYYIVATDTELIIHEGFELTRKVKTVLLDQPTNMVIYNTLTAINEFRGSRCQRTWVVFDTKTPSLVVDIFRYLPYLKTQVIKNLFGNTILLKDIPTALCLIKLLELTFILRQSKDTGILREFENTVHGKTSFYEFMESTLDNNHFWLLFNHMYLNEKFHVLFGRKIGASVLEQVDCIEKFDIKKLTMLIFQLVDINDNNKFNVQRTTHIQVTDNKQLVHYLKKGELPKDNVSATNKGEVAHLDVGLVEKDTNIAHFFQWSAFPKKKDKQKLLCNHFILSSLDKSPERWNIIKKRLQQTIFPKKMVSVNGRKTASDYAVKQGEKIKRKICALSDETFFIAESMFTARMYYNIEEKGNSFKEDLKQLFISDKIEKQLIYTKLLDYNIFSNKQEAGEFEDINIDEYMLHFRKKFRFCKYEGFYAATVLELFDMRHFDTEDLTRRIRDRNDGWLRTKMIDDKRVDHREIQVWIRYPSNDIYNSKLFLDHVQGFSKNLQNCYYELGGCNNQILLYFQKQGYKNQKRMDEVMCCATVELFRNDN